MDAETCLKKFGYIGVLAFATVDEHGDPQIRNISAIHYEPDAMYFLTARGKDFYRQLQSNGTVKVLGYTRYKEMIRLSGKAVAVPQEEQTRWVNTIFEEQPYLSNVYPGDTRSICIIFCIKDAEVEYYNLDAHPIFRESYTIGNGKITEKGYTITEACTGCGACSVVCPSRCIVGETPYRIQKEHCGHCGACYLQCPVKAIKKL